MCTVSFIPSGENIFITSNRDESPGRKIAYPPACYDHNGVKLFYPKDKDAGGTWMAIKENGDAAVLLNGAFICHQPEPPYKKSRGLIMLEICSMPDIPDALLHKDLSDIEPFTILMFEKSKLKEFRWDGEEKYFKELDPGQHHLLCSSTIYDGFETRQRDKTLMNFLQDHPDPVHDEILKLHSGETGYSYDSFLVPQKHTGFLTVSITSIQLKKRAGTLIYQDLIQKKENSLHIDFTKVNEFPG